MIVMIQEIEPYNMYTVSMAGVLGEMERDSQQRGARRQQPRKGE